MIEKIKKILAGWQKVEERDRPKTFWKYFIYYPLNWSWTLGSILFIGVFIEGGIKYESPLCLTAFLFPLIMLIYNLVDEYYAFQWYITRLRKVSAFTLQNIAKYACGGVMLYLVIRTFITG